MYIYPDHMQKTPPKKPKLFYSFILFKWSNELIVTSNPTASQ